MSRNNKSGLDYFPLDVDIFNDEKIELLSAKCGLISELIIIKLFAKIYHNSYFIKWDDDVAYLFAKKNCDGIQKEKIDEIVNESMRIDIFNQELFGIYSILTSKCIQNIYIEATKRRNRIDVFKEYLLLDEKNVNILNKNVNIIELNVNINTQSKVKESKVKESKKDILSDKSDGIDYKIIINYLNEKLGTAYRPSTPKYRSLIHARFEEKFTVDDFKYVIDIKFQEWNGTEQEKYLRPETLFGTKFQSYRNQKRQLTKEERDEKSEKEVIDEYYRKHPDKAKDDGYKL